MGYIYGAMRIGLPAELSVSVEGIQKESYVFDFACTLVMVLFTEIGSIGNPVYC